MPRSPGALEALIHELDEVCAMAGNQDDPALSQASLEVARALSSLNRLGRKRFHLAPQPEDAADGVVDEARRALARARDALARRPAPRRPAGAAKAPEAEGPRQGVVAVSCGGCGRRFRVQYLASADEPLVAFPMACPWDECDGVTEVSYPAGAVQVEVVPAVS